jgi:hypothetical protein
VKILAAGISHKTAPVELREPLAVKHVLSAAKLSLNVLNADRALCLPGGSFLNGKSYYDCIY